VSPPHSTGPRPQEAVQLDQRMLATVAAIRMGPRTAAVGNASLSENLAITYIWDAGARRLFHQIWSDLVYSGMRSKIVLDENNQGIASPVVGTEESCQCA
jgi:hypothetical protein